MTTNADGVGSKSCPITYDRHTPEYRKTFVCLTEELHTRCPLAWTDSYGGHWVASDLPQLFDLARDTTLLSNDYDGTGERAGYRGVLIPSDAHDTYRGGILEMDPPEQQYYRKQLYPYLSQAAVGRWVPVIDEITRACLDEVIETGAIDFVDDLATIVPAVLTMGLLGLPLRDWKVYSHPVHAMIYTDPTSPEMADVLVAVANYKATLEDWVLRIRAEPSPGLIDALNTLTIDGKPIAHTDVMGTSDLLITGGFDTTSALTARSLEWLSQHPQERTRLQANLETMLNSATEEFLRFFTPAQGDGRTIARDTEINGRSLKEGERLWLSWAMANRSAGVFPNPNVVDLERTGNRHTSFGLGVHRCIGSNVARNMFKRILVQVLERIPDFVCDPDGTIHYPSIGIINGMLKLPATFTPGQRRGKGLDETIDHLQEVILDQRLAEPVTLNKGIAKI
jgi:cytochrome P450